MRFCTVYVCAVSAGPWSTTTASRSRPAATVRSATPATPPQISASGHAPSCASPGRIRYRRSLPPEILETQPDGYFWLILGAGDAKYRFRLSSICYIEPTRGLLVRKIPDATPEIISRYALSDEQGLLAKVRYNRLLDIFLGISTYSLQNHLRTKIPDYGQIEIAEVYVGLDSR